MRSPSARCTSRPGAAPIPASCPTPTSPALRLRGRRRTTTRRSAAASACSSPPPPASTCRPAAARASSASPPPAGARAAARSRRRLAEGEIETLYVLDDWRERGVGRRLMRAAAAHLADIGCRSALPLGAARQPEPLVLRAAGRQGGGRGDDPGRRRAGGADRLRLVADRDGWCRRRRWRRDDFARSGEQCRRNHRAGRILPHRQLSHAIVRCAARQLPHSAGRDAAGRGGAVERGRAACGKHCCTSCKCISGRSMRSWCSRHGSAR